MASLVPVADVKGPAGPGIPAGGVVGQVVTKTGPSDYATGWASGFITLADGAPVPAGTPANTVIIRYSTV